MTSHEPIRVLVVDDHAVVRGGLLFFLAAVDDIVVVGEASSGDMAVRCCAELNPHVVLMDVIMPGSDGVSATQQIRQRYPQTQVIALTSFQEGDLVQRILEAGAIGYLLKDVEIDELVDAIRTAAAGQFTITPAATQALVQSMSRPLQTAYQLSQREREVLVLMIEGWNNEQIARHLQISRNTVRHHVHNILTKLGVANRTEAVGVAVRHHLI